jgi:glutamyl-tRNA synthetase
MTATPPHPGAPGNPAHPVTRLAPSPTGQLHLGNARTLLLTWAMARCMGWSLILRIEDLDPSRTRAGDIERCIADLAWLGIDWDGDPAIQSARTGVHWRALDALASAGTVYRSAHSRAEIRRASQDSDALHAPHGIASVVRFPPELRPARSGPDWIARAPAHAGPAGADADPSASGADAHASASPDGNLRLAVDPGTERVHECAGDAFDADPLALFGDPIVWTKAGLPAYHLAVCADDIAQDVTDVVRGVDLSEAAALHARIWRMLGATPPRWWHLPLLMDLDGQRMAKRQGSMTIASLRESGTTPERIAGFCAWSAGLHGGDLVPMAPSTLAEIATERAISAWVRAPHHGELASRSTLTSAAVEWLASR